MSTIDPLSRRPPRRRLVVPTTAIVLAALAACGGPEDARRGGNAAVVPPPPEAPATTPTRADVEEAEEPVLWLAAHQSPSGLWEAADWDRWRMGERFTGERLPGRGSPALDIAVTSLALLAYAGAGYTPASTSHRGAVVAWGLHALREAQDVDGALGNPKDATWPVNHGLAIFALASHAALHPDPRLDDALRRGVARYRRSRAVEPARWTSDRVFGGLPAFAWMALASDARLAGMTWGPNRELPSLTALTADLALARDRAEVASWITLPEAERTLTKVGAALALGTGEGEAWSKLPTVVAAAAWLGAHAPTWEPAGRGVDAMGWWLGTLGAFAAGGEPWRRWEAALKPAVIDTQRKDTSWCELKGSWDPIGAGAQEGGRLFTTLTCALTVEVWYRYDEVLGVSASGESTIAPEKPPTPKLVDPTPRKRHYGPCR